VSIATTKPVLWEVADVVGQVFAIACVADLTPTAEHRYAAILGYQADHDLSVPQMRERLRCCYGTMREVDERARHVRLMRLYAGRWRVWEFRGGRGFGTGRMSTHNLGGRRSALPWWGSVVGSEVAEQHMSLYLQALGR
jgi:hypothetical protein